MKQLIALLFISTLGFSQGNKLLLSQIQYAPGTNYCIVTNSLGVQTYTPCNSVTGLLPTTTSITINGTTKSFTSTPTFTVGDLFSTSSYTNPSWISSLDWAKITGTPTTLSGYGITNPIIQGTLSPNYILKGAGTQSVTSSSIYDDGSFVQIGSTGPQFATEKLNVNGSIVTSNSGFVIKDPMSVSDYWQIYSGTGTLNFGHSGLSDFMSVNVNNPYTISTHSAYDFIYNKGTANTLMYLDGSNRMRSVTIGSGIDLTTGTLSAVGQTLTPGYIAYGSATNTLTGVSTFSWDASTDILRIGSSYIKKTTMGGITTNALEMAPGSNIGIFSVRTNSANAATRSYIMPNGTPTGTTAKFEIFNTDYSTGSANYNGFNIFCSNTSNTFFFGPNRAGSATRMKYVMGGDFVGSIITSTCSTVELASTDVLINETQGGNVGIKQSSPAEALDVNGNVRIRNLTSNKILYGDGNKNVASASLGTGLSLTTGTLAYTPTLSVSGSSLSIAGGNTVVISGGGTDSQTLSVSGNSLTISGGNTVELPAGGGATSIVAGTNITTNFGSSTYTVSTVTTPTFTSAHFTSPALVNNDLGLYKVYMTGGNATTTSSVSAAVSEMSLSVAANTRYRITGQVHIGCDNTGGVKVSMTLPTGATMYLKVFGATTSVTAYQFSPLSTSGSLSLAFCQVNNANYFLNFEGEISISSTAGSAVLGFASTTNGQTSTVYQLGTELDFSIKN